MTNEEIRARIADDSRQIANIEFLVNSLENIIGAYKQQIADLTDEISILLANLSEEKHGH